MPDMYAFQAAPQSNTQNAPEDKNTNPVPQVTPNVLPCRVFYDGPVDATERFWAPAAEEKGVIAAPTERLLPTSPPKHQDADVEIVEPEEPVKVLETQGTFEDVVVWGHEILPAADDTFVKGVEEWVRFAETMHAPASTASDTKAQ